MTWIRGLLRRRPDRLALAAAGVAVAVALVASIATFLAGALATMTLAATRQVAVDWQVEARSGAGPDTVLAGVRGDGHVREALPVGFAATSGLQALAGGTTQATGPGMVVGLPDGYGSAFPLQLRILTGDPSGTLLAQQTAANLHAGIGDTVTIGRAGLSPVAVRIDGIVDLPQADSLFQTVGAPPGAQPSAPPDNVVVMPIGRWRGLFDPLRVVRPDLVRDQVHARVDRRLPRDPAGAFTQVVAEAHHLEVVLAGNGVVANNLGAALDSARSDALYAQILFLLLGSPGVVLAGLVTCAVAAAGGDRRRREFALLRARGATVQAMVRLAAAEAVVVALVGGAVGLAGAAILGRAALGSATFGASAGLAAVWATAAAGAGLAVAAGALVVPAWRDARRLNVAAARQPLGRAQPPWWLRAGLDGWLLGAAALVFWLTSRSGYQIVLVPEGLPTLSVNYWALAGPLLFWVGAGMAVWRLSLLTFGRGRSAVRQVVKPVAGRLADTVATTLNRQRDRLARPIALVALTVAFAASTAVFNTTYRHQVGVDARLTNGADVTVGYPPASPAPSTTTADLMSVPGVRHVEPLVHRYAYVGSDLQDLYGVHPATIVDAGSLQDSYFRGASARALIGRLGQRTDSILVSAETARDFQLTPGDVVRLRVRDARTGQLTEVPFRYAGVVKEFPTAPRDSFLVANADYVSARTGGGIDAFLVTTGGKSPPEVAAAIRSRLGPGSSISDLATSRRQVGSALTAVNLSGLTRIELGFAFLLAAAATGLVLLVSLAERRRSFAIARALGARNRQLGAFVRAEAAVVTTLGLALGAAAGWVLAELLVKILTGVFDPPPTTLAVPWRYLALVGALAVAAAVVASEVTLRAARRPVVETIRDL